MSKYKVGDKVVLTVTDTNEMGCLPCYVLNDDLILSRQEIDKYSEPLSTYTLPLEDKIRRQAEEITRLLAENKELKEENEKLLCKVDSYELYGDQHEEEYNQAFNQGAETAWELARKMNNYEFYVNVSEFQKKLLEFVNSGELDKFFENTVFDNYEYKNDCKSAMITGMSLASMITSDC